MKKDYRLYQKPKQTVFTREGYEDMQRKYDTLKSERPHAVSELKKARELGDLRENGYYKASRQRLSFIDSQLARLGSLLRYGIVSEKTQSEVIELGSTVVLEVGGKEVTYTIVGVHEANPSDGKVSIVSPLGSQLIGKKVGEKALVREFEYTILKIS